MGFFSNWVTAIGERRQLIREVDFLTSNQKKLEWKCEQLEKQVIKERLAKDKLQVSLMDYVARREGGVGRFNTAIEEESKPAPEPQLSPEEETEIWAAAELMRNDDIENGYDPRPVEVYANIIRENKNKYILN